MSAGKEKSVRRGRRQRGAALLIFSILVVMAALAYLLSGLAPELTEARRERQTQEVLAQARDALIGYALQYREQQRGTGTLDAMYGYLPMPDVGTTRFSALQPASCNIEGCAMSALNGAFPSDTETVIGRFPWRTLGLEPIRDANGECLWYVVSANHKSLGMSSTVRMNWDTLGHIDIVVANGSAALASILSAANAHERPVAVIFSPGPPLPGQNRNPSATDDVTNCGGNYDVKNYLDPFAATALVDVTNYLSGTNNASGNTGKYDTVADPNPVKKLSTHGKVFESGSNFLTGGCQGANCNLVANDSGLELSGNTLFGAIRKHAYFRTDINSMLDRMVDCLRDQGVPGPNAKIPGLDSDVNLCYGFNKVPLGYFPHYREMVFVAAGSPSVNGTSCAGALLLSGQRGPGQLRQSSADRNLASNYLEGINFTNFTTSGTVFSGPEQFELVSPTQTAFQDIVRCIPSTPSFVTTQSPGLMAAGLPQFANYSPSTRILTLGQFVGTALGSSLSNFLYGCAWRPESRNLGGGLRGYFTFNIKDPGIISTWSNEGFAFAIVDSDNNGTDACGAAAQHLGYSGNNTESPFIAQPKIAFEIDTRRETGFNPASTNHLLNGRNDPPSPSYRGGHVSISYWGGETAINTTLAPPCTSPAFDFGGTCYLPQEEDDNIHAQPASARGGFPAPPANPAIPATPLTIPPDSPAGAYKLDPTLSQTPVNQDFHVRVELTRTNYVRVASVSDLDLNAPGNPINGVVLTAGDRVWVRYQTISSENGLYVWNGAAIPMTRVADGESTANYSLPRVRAATNGTIDINLPGDTIDSVYLFSGDRILVKDQMIDPAQNGVYVWQAANLPLARASDADSSAELAGMVVEVQQGTQNARSIWRQNTTNLIIGTTALSWTNLRVKLAAPATTDLASPGAELDGIKMKMNDRVFVKSKGVYLWKGAAVPMIPATDIVTGSSIVQIQQGSEANALWQINGGGSARLYVRVASQTNLNLAAPGASIDGVTLAFGDRVLVKNQSNAAENGIYVWNGAGVAMSRTPDANTADALAGALTQVLAGSDVGRSFRQTSLAADGTLGTSAVQWAAIDRSTSYLLEIWILLDSPSYTDKIAAMKDTTRAMSVLYPGFSPHLQDRPIIPYSFRNARLGFTTGQRTSINDQTILISNTFTSWLE